MDNTSPEQGAHEAWQSDPSEASRPQGTGRCSKKLTNQGIFSGSTRELLEWPGEEPQ